MRHHGEIELGLLSGTLSRRLQLGYVHCSPVRSDTRLYLYVTLRIDDYCVVTLKQTEGSTDQKARSLLLLFIFQSRNTNWSHDQSADVCAVCRTSTGAGCRPATRLAFIRFSSSSDVAQRRVAACRVLIVRLAFFPPTFDQNNSTNDYRKVLSSSNLKRPRSVID